MNLLKNNSKLSYRFIFKIITNLLTAIFNFIFAIIIPRALGPVNFGLFELINSNMNQFISMFSVGTNGAFYTKLSQRPNDLGLIQFYLKILLFIFILLSLLVFVSSFYINYDNILEFENSLFYIFFSLIYCYGLYLLNTSKDACDAYLLTIKNEVFIIIYKFLGLIIVLLLFTSDYLNIHTLYLKEILVSLVIPLTSFLIIRKYWIKNAIQPIYSKFKNLILEFWSYCHPLIVVTFITAIGAVADRWILQSFSGSLEQGYFSIALRLSSVSLIFASALSSLIVREVAVYIKKKKYSKLRVLMLTSLKSMYVLVSFFSVFIYLFSEEITLILFGKEYLGAVISVSILTFYPMHQVYGQYTSSFLLGSSLTKIHRDITIFSTILALSLSWIFIAPKDLYGLELGSIGLSLSLVIVNLITTNIRLHFITKKLDLSFFEFIFHQIISFIVILTMGYFIKLIIDLFNLSIYNNLIIHFTVFFAVFLLMCFNLTFLTGFKKNKLKDMFKTLMYLKKIN